MANANAAVAVPTTCPHEKAGRRLRLAARRRRAPRERASALPSPACRYVPLGDCYLGPSGEIPFGLCSSSLDAPGPAALTTRSAITARELSHCSAGASFSMPSGGVAGARRPAGTSSSARDRGAKATPTCRRSRDGSCPCCVSSASQLIRADLSDHRESADSTGLPMYAQCLSKTPCDRRFR